LKLSVHELLGVLFIRQNTYSHARLLGSLSWSLADRTAYKEHLGSLLPASYLQATAKIYHFAYALSLRWCEYAHHKRMPAK
jgi:hypothetical protein